MLTTVNVQNNINAAKYGSLVAIGDSDGTVTLIELCESLYVPQSTEKLSIKQMLEREYTREKNLKNAKRSTEGRRTARRDETLIAKQKEKQQEKIRKLEVDFFAQVGIPGEEIKANGKKHTDEVPVPVKEKPAEIVPELQAKAKVEAKVEAKVDVKVEAKVETQDKAEESKAKDKIDHEDKNENEEKNDSEDKEKPSIDND